MYSCLLTFFSQFVYDIHCWLLNSSFNYQYMDFLQTVESESLLKPILSAEEFPGKSMFVFLKQKLWLNCLISYSAFFLFWFTAFLSWWYAVCVHGTYRKNLESILESGLKRMKRLHVHFSCGLPTDGEVISGNMSIFWCLGIYGAWHCPLSLSTQPHKCGF
jgi:hypothetical protein